MVETARKVAPLDDGPDWNFDLLDIYHQEIARVAKFYRLDTYPNQIEVITAEQMMDAYSSVGMPIGYQHWSFGPIDMIMTHSFVNKLVTACQQLIYSLAFFLGT